MSPCKEHQDKTVGKTAVYCALLVGWVVASLPGHFQCAYVTFELCEVKQAQFKGYLCGQEGGAGDGMGTRLAEMHIAADYTLVLIENCPLQAYIWLLIKVAGSILLNPEFYSFEVTKSLWIPKRTIFEVPLGLTLNTSHKCPCSHPTHSNHTQS